MENLINQLKFDIKLMMSLTQKISSFQTEILFRSNLKDKKNFDEKRCKLISIRVKVLIAQLNELETKWGV